MNSPSLSKSTPRSGNGNSVIAAVSVSMTSAPLRATNGRHSVQPVAMSVKTIVCTKLPAADVPECATKVHFDESRRRIVPVAECADRHCSSDYRTQAGPTSPSATRDQPNLTQQAVDRRWTDRQHQSTDRFVDRELPVPLQCRQQHR